MILPADDPPPDPTDARRSARLSRPPSHRFEVKCDHDRVGYHLEPMTPERFEVFGRHGVPAEYLEPATGRGAG